MPNIWGFAFAAFLAAHGVATITMYLAPMKPDAPFQAARSWLLSRAGVPEDATSMLSRTLAVIAAVGFFLAALGVLGVPGFVLVWHGMIVLGAVTSLVLLALFFHPWLTAGVIINVALLLVVLVYLEAAREALGF